MMEEPTHSDEDGFDFSELKIVVVNKGMLYAFDAECNMVWCAPDTIIVRRCAMERIDHYVHEFSEIAISRAANLISDDLVWVAHEMLEMLENE